MPSPGPCHVPGTLMGVRKHAKKISLPVTPRCLQQSQTCPSFAQKHLARDTGTGGLHMEPRYPRSLSQDPGLNRSQATGTVHGVCGTTRSCLSNLKYLSVTWSCPSYHPNSHLLMTHLHECLPSPKRFFQTSYHRGFSSINITATSEGLLLTSVPCLPYSVPCLALPLEDCHSQKESICGVVGCLASSLEGRLREGSGFTDVGSRLRRGLFAIFTKYLMSLFLSQVLE